MAATLAPPMYNNTGVDDFVTDPFDTGAGELPSYSRRGAVSPTPTQRSTASQRVPREFSYDMLTRKNSPWLVLTVCGNSLLSKHAPVIVEGSELTGSVKLLLDSSDLIQSISVSVLGLIISGANPGDTYTFLELNQVLWAKAHSGDPRQPGSAGRFSGKLPPGEYAWPFSFAMPPEVTLYVGAGAHGAERNFRLPQTFLERHARASVQYSVVVRVVRNKLRPDSKLTATFGFLPITKPSPPSPLRQLAYQENSPLLGPGGDPDGWHMVGQTIIRGTLFGQRPVNALCSLYIAKPLCYTRGTVLPCFMTIESPDMQALDLLSSPKAIMVRLRRNIKYHEFRTMAVDAMTWRDSVDDTDPAVWWPSTEGEEADTLVRRHLCGEIQLKKTLKPSTAIGNFRIEYLVTLLPFDATAFVSTDTEPLLEQAVEIATVYAPGPRPRAYSPPIYEPPVRVDPYYSPLDAAFQ
ncbi:hypothetical protein HGRIS_003340 [Hohenbuehelia grisea]|uniref:Arrestin-like N-terminal domain-containing protein n=1 Tax=Hohenbuehelia grisea TaxID=104357 RepID=A0ABR3JF57_9AGAR